MLARIGMELSQPESVAAEVPLPDFLAERDSSAAHVAAHYRTWVPRVLGQHIAVSRAGIELGQCEPLAEQD